MVRWNDDNDLMTTELLIQKSLSNELAASKKIIEISENEIIYTDKNYNMQKITWANDSLFIKSKPLNKPEIKIIIQNIELLQNKKVNNYYSVEEMDENKDRKINNSELEKISFILFNILINNNNRNQNLQFKHKIQ